MVFNYLFLVELSGRLKNNRNILRIIILRLSLCVKGRTQTKISDGVFERKVLDNHWFYFVRAVEF